MADGTVLLQFFVEIRIIELDPGFFGAPENPDFLAGREGVFIFGDGAGFVAAAIAAYAIG